MVIGGGLVVTWLLVVLPVPLLSCSCIPWIMHVLDWPTMPNQPRRVFQFSST